MERTFLETVQFLGLDMELAIVAVMVALQGLLGLAGQVRARRRKAPRPAVRNALLPATAAWPPRGWRPNH